MPTNSNNITTYINTTLAYSLEPKNRVNSDSTLKVKRVYQEIIDKSIPQVLKKAKNPLSSSSQKKYETLENHVSYRGCSEINTHIENKAREIKDPGLIRVKEGEIQKKFKEGTHIKELMCSGGLRAYLASLINKNKSIQELNKNAQRKVLESANKQLDDAIDNIILNENLKIPTIASIKDLVSVIVDEVFTNQIEVIVDEDPTVKLRESKLSKSLEREFDKITKNHGFLTKRCGWVFESETAVSENLKGSNVINGHVANN